MRKNANQLRHIIDEAVPDELTIIDFLQSLDIEPEQFGQFVAQHYSTLTEEKSYDHGQAVFYVCVVCLMLGTKLVPLPGLE